MLIPDPLRVPKDLNYEIVAPSNNSFNQWLTIYPADDRDCWRLGGCLGLSASSDMNIIYLNFKK